MAETIAPSRAERSHISSVTRNLRARLKKVAGPLLALTAMTWRGLAGSSGDAGVEGDVLSDAWSRVAAGFFSSETPTSCSSESAGGDSGICGGV